MPDKRHGCETSAWPGSTPAQTDSFSGRASWETSLLSVVWLGRLWCQTQLIFLFFPLTFANWNRKCWISGDQIAAGWQEGERMDEIQQQKPGNMLDLHFATKDSDSCMYWFTVLSTMHVFACIWKKNLNSWHKSSHSSVKGVLRVKLKRTAQYLRKMWEV